MQYVHLSPEIDRVVNFFVPVLGRIPSGVTELGWDMCCKGGGGFLAWLKSTNLDPELDFI